MGGSFLVCLFCVFVVVVGFLFVVVVVGFFFVPR